MGLPHDFLPHDFLAVESVAKMAKEPLNKNNLVSRLLLEENRWITSRALKARFWPVNRAFKARFVGSEVAKRHLGSTRGNRVLETRFPRVVHVG